MGQTKFIVFLIPKILCKFISYSFLCLQKTADLLKMEKSTQHERTFMSDVSFKILQYFGIKKFPSRDIKSFYLQKSTNFLKTRLPTNA